MSRQIPSSSSLHSLSNSGDQADQILDRVFADLEDMLEDMDPGWELEAGYPYSGSRPPLPCRRSGIRGWVLIPALAVLTGVAALAFWISSRPVPVPLVRSELSSGPQDSGQPEHSVVLGAEEVNLDRSQFELEPWVIDSGAEAQERSDPGADSSSPTGSTAAQPRSAPDRSAATAPAARPATAAIAPAWPGTAPPMKLVGIVHDPGAPIALIQMDDVVRQVPVGQVVQPGWQVVSIAPQGVAVSNGQHRYTLQLGLGRNL